MFRKRYKQDRYFDSDDPENPHGRWYGPCDGFGPDNVCSACSGLIGRTDGSIVNLEGKVIRKADWRHRLQHAWWSLRGAYVELRGER